MSAMAAEARPSSRRTRVLAVVLVLIGLPLVLVLVEAVSFHVRNRSNGSLVSSGEKREYLLHVPKRYDHARPTPLVISMHGAALWGAAQRDISQWNEVAESEGLIVVYPSGVKGRGPRIWRADGGSDLKWDVTFISQLIDTLSATYNIDPTRIYADGLSNGGGMAFALSCTLSNRIAAVGLVASAQLLPWDWCTDRRAVPMIAFHGTADSYAPYNGGRSWVAPNPFANIRTWTANWARRNGCGAIPVETVIAVDVTRRAFTDCAHGADVVLYTVHEGGHTWPGGGPMPAWLVGRTSDGVDATHEMWAFFREHPLRPR